MRGIGPAKFINTTNAAKRPELKILDYLHELGYILASSKGLLLLGLDPMSYYVYDLVCKKHVKLPRTLIKYSYVDVGFVCKEQHKQGSYHLRYKVVCTGTTHHEHMYKSKTQKLETYSSETDKWQILIMTAKSEFGLGPHFTAKVIGGVFHWFEVEGLKLVEYNPDDSEGHTKLIELPSDQVFLYSVRKDLREHKTMNVFNFITSTNPLMCGYSRVNKRMVVEAIWMRRMIWLNRTDGSKLIESRWSFFHLKLEFLFYIL